MIELFGAVLSEIFRLIYTFTLEQNSVNSMQF